MRIASLLASGTEILFALRLGDQVVAVSHECDYPPAARHLPRVTRSLIDSAAASRLIDEQVQAHASSGAALYEIDAELIGRLLPDLIVTQAQCDVCAVRYADVIELVQSRPELRRTSVLALNPQSLDEVLDDVVRVGRAADALRAADEAVARLRLRIDRIGTVTANLRSSERPRVVCLEWLDPLMAAGNWTPQIIELAGGRSGLAAAGRHSQYHAWDEVRSFDPQVLVVAPCGFDLARSVAEAQLLWKLPGFAELAAVQADRAFVLDGSAYLNRSGPRLVDSLEILAHLVQPQRFGPPTGAHSEGLAWARQRRTAE